jgi:hypothetical protein
MTLRDLTHVVRWKDGTGAEKQVFSDAEGAGSLFTILQAAHKRTWQQDSTMPYPYTNPKDEPIRSKVLKVELEQIP